MMKKISPRNLKENAIDLIGQQWMLVTAGNPDSFNTMTASWGALGHLWTADVAFVFVRPQRYTYEFTESNDIMTLSFFDERYRQALNICGTRSGRDTDKIKATGLTPFTTENGSVAFTEARLVLECRKLYADDLKNDAFLDTAVREKAYPDKDFHMMYVVEILNAWMDES